MNFEQAKAIVQDMANGTATTEDEAALEEWALQEWGHDGSYGERVVVLGDRTPHSSGQLHYKSVRDAIEGARNLASDWHDTVRTHPLLGYVDGGDDSYGYPVYTSKYTESVERKEDGNFIEVSRWIDRDFDILVRFPCAQGLVKDVGENDDTDKRLHFFKRDFVQCGSCANVAGLLVVCPQCLKTAIDTGNCSLSQEAVI